MPFFGSTYLLSLFYIISILTVILTKIIGQFWLGLVIIDFYVEYGSIIVLILILSPEYLYWYLYSYLT